MAIPSFFAQTPFLTALYNEGMARKYPAVALAGLAGNIWGESRGDHRAIGDNGHAIGAAQWNDRSPMLKSFAAQNGTSWQDPTAQAKFLFHELDTSERKAKDALMSARDPVSAAKAGLLFERPYGYNMPNFEKVSSLHWNDRMNAAQKAFAELNGGAGDTSGVSPHAFARHSSLGATSGNPIQQSFAPEAAAPEPQPTQIAMNDDPNAQMWDRLGNIGNGLTGLGAAIMAINNPAGASVLANLSKQNKSRQWQFRGFMPNGKGMMFQGPNGETRIDPVPEAYQGPKESDVPSDVRALEILSKRPDLLETNDRLHGRSAPTDEANDTLKFIGDMWLQGDDKAFSRFSEASRTKGIQMALDDIARVTGEKPTAADVMQNRGAYQQLMSSERKYGQMIEPIQAAKADLDAAVETAKGALKDMPAALTKHNLTLNKLMQKTAEEWQGEGAPELAKYRESLEAVARAYSQVLGRGVSNSSVRSDEVARNLLSTAMSPETVSGVLDFMKTSGGRVVESVKRGHQELRDEWKANRIGAGVKQREDELLKEINDRLKPQSAPAPAQGATDAAQKAAPKRLKWNPQTGLIE